MIACCGRNVERAVHMAWACSWNEHPAQWMTLRRNEQIPGAVSESLAIPQGRSDRGALVGEIAHLSMHDTDLRVSARNAATARRVRIPSAQATFAQSAAMQCNHE